MNGILDAVEMKMLQELMKTKILGKTYTDPKKFVKEMVRQAYLNL